MNKYSINSETINGGFRKSLGNVFLDCDINLTTDFNISVIRNISFENNIEIISDFSTTFLATRVVNLSESIPIISDWFIDHLSTAFLETNFRIEPSLQAKIIRETSITNSLEVSSDINAIVVRNISIDSSVEIIPNILLSTVKDLYIASEIPVQSSFLLNNIKNVFVDTNFFIEGFFETKLLRNVLFDDSVALQSIISGIVFDTISNEPFRSRAGINSRGAINSKFGIGGLGHYPIIRTGYFQEKIIFDSNFQSNIIRNAKVELSNIIVSNIAVTTIKVSSFSKTIPFQSAFNSKVIRNSNIVTDVLFNPNFYCVYEQNIQFFDTAGIFIKANETSIVECDFSGSYSKTTDESIDNVFSYMLAKNVSSERQSVYSSPPSVQLDTKVPWSLSKAQSLQVGSDYIQLFINNTEEYLKWKEAKYNDRYTNSFYKFLVKNDFSEKGSYKETSQLNKVSYCSSNEAVKGDKQQSSYYKWAKPLTGYSNFVSVVPPIPVPVEDELDFRCSWFEQYLDFGYTCKKTIIKERTYYYVLNDILVKRISGNIPIEVTSIQISTDTDSWGWRLSATVLGEASYDALVEFPNAEILVQINGYDWKFFVTNITHSTTFGKNNYSLTGIGISAELSSLFSIAQSYTAPQALTLQQVVDHELYDTGWEESWGTYNWLIPGNTHSYTNQTPINVIAEAVKAAGAFVYSDPTLKKLWIKNRYPAYPWEIPYATSDVVMSFNPITSLDKSIQRGNNYDGVYVSGTTPQGILAYVHRGNLRTPDNTISHPLITHTDAARAYGSAFIADDMDRTEYKLTLPLSEQVPLLLPAQLVKVVNNFSMITESVSISVTLSNKSVVVRQNIEGNSY